MFEHEHPLNLTDLWLEELQHEDEYEEDEDGLISIQNFRCSCFRCDEEINRFHRYYYKCSQCDYSIHKFCADLPERLEDICHAHTLYLIQRLVEWSCNICFKDHEPHELRYRCSECDFDVDVKCATIRQLKNIIHHPSHIHPLVRMPKQILSECDACGEEHKGIFYRCTMCPDSFIHNHCAFLPKFLQIEHATDNLFSHIHKLALAYSFPEEDQESRFEPLCRVCRKDFSNPKIWIYKCEKCRYYAHLHCATSRNEPFMSILAYPGTGKTFKNFKDAEHPNLLRLPFPDPSYSILKNLFFKEDGSSTFKINEVRKTHISHQHPLILIMEDARSTDITRPTSSRIKSISFHDPMKRIELLCDGCLRPITTTPIYMCANDCNFVLHEWCSRLPTELNDHFSHPQHTLILHSKIPNYELAFFGVSKCDICDLHCNGFVYFCDKCKYHIDVNCAFLPKEITHDSHPNHLLSRVLYNKYEPYKRCICGYYIREKELSFCCHYCDFHLHPMCALLIPETTKHKCDKHPMKLSYLPIENHMSDYFCEICEQEFDPNCSFYHCHECAQSMHTACAPSILRYETYTSTYYPGFAEAIYRYVNVKFGGTYNNIIIHPHPLSFVQGIQSDGNCTNCDIELQYQIIFKCLKCKFAIDYDCCRRMVEVN